MATVLDDLRLVTASQAAELLATSLRTIDRLVEAGRLTPVRLGDRGHRRFRLREVRALVEAHEEEG